MSMPPATEPAPGRSRLRAYWPVYGLRLRTPRLTLEMIADDDLPELIEATLAGIHDPGRMPFAVPWTDAPPEEIVPNSLRHYWESRSRFSPASWSIPFAVRHDGLFCGIQELAATNFALLRTVSTGSWLRRSVQGRGFGTEMRAAVLQLAFDHLGAIEAESGAFADNPPSLAVSRRLGYLPDGTDIRERRPGEAARHLRLVVTPHTFVRPGWTVEVDGLDACRSQLGLPEADQSASPMRRQAAE